MLVLYDGLVTTPTLETELTAWPIWLHLPADGHRRGANLGYTDGHFAYQCWKWPKVFRQYDQEPANAHDQADLDFIREGTPRE